jgi:cell division protein FtsI (penicillin-binding protein 3)
MTLEPGPLSADPRRADRWVRARVHLAAGVLALIFAIIVGRAGQIALGGEAVGADPARAAVQQVARADILDRHGVLLATSVPSWSLAADPSALWDPEEAAQRLATALPGLDAAALAERLSNRERRFVWIQRGLTPRQRDAVFDLGLEGLRFERELRRIYPGGRLAGHLLGYTNIDGRGMDGVERAFNDQLAAGGEPIRLTLDAGVQFALESELEQAVRDFEMKGAAGIVMDAHTGAVRALASWPFYDPNTPTAVSQDVRTNRAISAVYELGSIYKPLTIAAALESGAVSLGQTFDVSRPLRIRDAMVRDLHSMQNPQEASLADILAESSNVGTALVAQSLGVDRQRDYLARFGLLSRPDYEGPVAAAPLTPAEWDPVTAATVSFGHGVAVSPIAFAASFATFGHGGLKVSPVFVEPDPDDAAAASAPIRIVSEAVAREVTAMMRTSVTSGTGRNANAPGYEVAGKTGTAEKPGPDGYDPDRNVTSFAAVFPASRPQFVVLIVLDEAVPRAGAGAGERRTAAYTSAMIAGRLIARASPVLGVEPQPVGTRGAEAPRTAPEGTARTL